MRKFTADFETTTNPDDCRVWGYSVCEICPEFPLEWGTSIDEFMDLLASPYENYVVYFHNLKFDGEFIFQWLFKHGYTHVKDKKELETKTFATLISNQGQFYSIEIMFKKHGKTVNRVTIYDSLKLLPMKVKDMAKGFNLPILKGEIDYDKDRPIGYVPDEEEISYMCNDVEIVARALSVLFDEGLIKMTQGSNALASYKVMITSKKFEYWFPELPYAVDQLIRQSYRGGFTYCNPQYQGKNIGAGIVLDVNSLYPSRMYLCPLPYGEPIYYNGKYSEDEIYPLFVQVIECHFDLKPGHLPTIQLHHSRFAIGTDYLTSNMGEDIQLCLTSVDLKLFFDHYDVYNIEYKGGYKFKSGCGAFKQYIDYWTERKTTAKAEGNGAHYILSKRMMNGLYGKFGLNPNVASKYPYMMDDVIHYETGGYEVRKSIYIPVASFITSYGRDMTIRAAQQVYDRFLYADTDSLHLIGLDIPDNIDVDKYKLGAWDCEMEFSRARYLRSKCYIEETSKGLKVTCAGLPEDSHTQVSWENFTYGASYSGKLTPKHVKGGIVLEDTLFTLKL